jgi:anti-sigma B factor antagonist
MVEIRDRAVGSMQVLEVVGRLVLSEGQSDNVLRDVINRFMNEGRRHFLIDLTRVQQVDTSGLTTLVAAQIVVRKSGGQIKLLNPTQRVRDLLRITRLNTLLEVCETEAEAIARFSAEPDSEV